MTAPSHLPSPMLQAALGYARRRWPVFPCNSKNKQPLVAADRDPISGKPIKGTGGVSKATTDEDQIRAWWTKHPDAMIGVAMGRNGLFALDFDPRVEEEVDDATGEVTGKREWTLEQLKAETEAQIGCALPITLAARTPSGGVHLYFKQPEGEPIRNRGNLPHHVDVRGAGGYVIAPPSRIVDPAPGVTAGDYRWLRGNWDAEIADAPAELVEVLRAPKARPDKDAAADQAASTSSSSPSSVAPFARSHEAAPPMTGDDPGEAAKRRYAMGALERECELLAKTPLGSRNNQSNASGFVIGQLVGAGALGESFARAALHQAVQGFNDPDKNAAAVDNGIEAGMAQPRDLSEIADEARRRADRQYRPRAALPASSPRPASGDGQGRQTSHGGGARDDSGRGRGRGEDEAGLTRRCAFHPLTDLGNLERFLERFGDDFLYVEQWGWLAWDGRRWNRDMAIPLLGHAVQKTMRAIQAEADFIRTSGVPFPDPDEISDLQSGVIETEDGRTDTSRLKFLMLQKMVARRVPDHGGARLDSIVKVKSGEITLYSDKLAAWGRTSEGAGHINCIARLAEARLSARTDDFDADPMLLNVENGTLVFLRPDQGMDAGVTRREHRREDRITKMANAVYDPKATCAKFDAFLAEVQPAQDMRDFLDVWAGYNALGLADAQKMAIFYGQGSNGKGVWINTMAHILGDYAWAAAIETFIDQGKYRKGSDASPDLAALVGRRMVYANEPEEGSKFSDGLIKSMTSDEPIGGVRELMKPPFQLLVTFTNTVSANHRPKIGTDHGIQRRVQIIPWDIIIPNERADPLLKSKLKAEASGILNRMVRGAIRYLTSGLPMPEAVKEATREYLEENDLLGQFITLCVEDAAGETVGATPLHNLFKAWQTWANQLPASGKPWSAKHLNAQMQRKGFKISKSSTMQWHDIFLRYDEASFVDAEGRPVTRELPPPRTLREGEAQPHPPPQTRPPVMDDDDDFPL